MSEEDRARVLIKLRRYDEAAELAREALVRHPTDASLFDALANALIADDPDCALDAAEEAARIRPEDPVVLETLTRCLMAVERLPAALEVCKRLRSVGAHLPESHAHYAAILHTLGVRWEKPRLVRAAYRSIRTAQELDPDLVYTHLVLGRMAFEEGDYGAAWAHTNKALWLDPDDVPARVLLGNIAERRGAYRVAGDHYLVAAKADPSSDGATSLARMRGTARRVSPFRLSSLAARWLQRVAIEQSLSSEAREVRDRARVVDAPTWRSGDWWVRGWRGGVIVTIAAVALIALVTSGTGPDSGDARAEGGELAAERSAVAVSDLEIGECLGTRIDGSLAWRLDSGVDVVDCAGPKYAILVGMVDSSVTTGTSEDGTTDRERLCAELAERALGMSVEAAGLESVVPASDVVPDGDTPCFVASAAPITVPTVVESP